MDHSDFHVCSFIENPIGLKELKKAFAQISLHSKNDVVNHCPAGMYSI